MEARGCINVPFSINADAICAPCAFAKIIKDAHV